VDTSQLIEGIIGETANFSMNYAVIQYADECLNNIRYCHNGWSLSTWLYLTPPLQGSSQHVIVSTQLPNSSYGVEVYGEQDADFYYLNVLLDGGVNKTSAKFEITTYAWVHLCISVSSNTSIVTVFFNGQNNTYINPVENISTGSVPSVGTLLPFSIGANATGRHQIAGMIDEFEVFEHELLDAETLEQGKSVYHYL